MAQNNFEKNGGTYTQVGDYLIPDLTLPPEEQNIHLGVWGCGCPVDTSAKGRSTDRAGSREVPNKCICVVVTNTMLDKTIPH